MKIVKTILYIALAFATMGNAFCQEITQVIKGKIIDSESQMPLSFATVSIVTTNPQIGGISDENGSFRLENVPVGRHNIKISCMGYENQMVPELMVTSGKELVLQIGLKERIEQVEEVVVKAYAKKDKPLNTMTSVSARTFSVEEAQRYAGGFDDPARLASSFAGVSTGHIDDNGIIVRGNAPKGLLWRLEGIEIPNPNHFAGMETFGGGGVSALSAHMLANSDFMTGAFPAEYGNAMSGVFDIKLRNGNNEKHEHAAQLSLMGVDISSEGPFSKNNKASYLFNYRYSTFGIIKPVLPEEANVPIYQDLCFKMNMPTEKAGIFSLWALGADDYIKFEADKDTSLWKTEEDSEEGDATQQMYASGLNHRYIFGNKTYINSTIAVSGDHIRYDQGLLNFDLTKSPDQSIKNTNYKYTITSVLNHKFSARHTNRTGFVANSLHYDNLIKFAPEFGDPLYTSVDESGSTYQVSVFSQSKIRFTERFTANIGVHGQYFNLNEEFLVEPRTGLTYNLTKTSSLSLAYGLHSRLEPLSIYFARVESENGAISFPNNNLRLGKAHHFVLAYDISLNQNLRLKVEPYLQLLHDVPVIKDSNYSTINMKADWFFDKELVNTGTGTNYGIDVTLERFLNNGYYYLITASLFDSKYVGGDNKQRNTRFDNTFVVNALFGKEWTLGIDKNKILGVNMRLNVLGGQRTTPVDVPLSEDMHEIIYDYTQEFEARKPNIYHLNASVNYRINKKNRAGILSIQVLNALCTQEDYGHNYNYRTRKVERDLVRVIVPNLSYKIEF